MKPRPCAYDKCGREFIPVRMGQKVCGPRCAGRLVKAKALAEKAAERAQTKARRMALETIPELIKKAQREFNNFIRLRDEGRPCICCGRTGTTVDSLHGHGWDAGHYRSTGSASHLRFTEDNCHRQLVVCNRNGAGRAVDYRIGLIQRIGLEAVEALEADNTVKKWTREELRLIAATYRAKRRALQLEKDE